MSNSISQESFSFIKNLPFLSRKFKSYKNCNTNRRPFERPKITKPEQRRPFERPKITEPEQLTMNFKIKKAITAQNKSPF